MSSDKGVRAVKDLQDWLPYATDALGKIEADLKSTAPTPPQVGTEEQRRHASICNEVTAAIQQLREVERSIQTPPAASAKVSNKKPRKKK